MAAFPIVVGVKFLPLKGKKAMPYYYFEAVSIEGRTQKKILKARDKKEADKRLRDSGLQPILIENAKITRKKKQQKKVTTRRTVRSTLFSVAGVSLVGGIAAYLIMLDMSKVNRFDVQTLARSGVVADTPGIINAKPGEQRDFAREVFGAWEMIYPDTLSGIEVKHKGLMLLYFKPGRKRFHKDDMKLRVSSIASAFHRRFETTNCMVLGSRGDETLFESQFRDGKVETTVY